MAVNKVDYEVLEKGRTTYASQAAIIGKVVADLDKMNKELQAGWTNKTSDEFIKRYESEHKKALNEAQKAIQSISDYIKKYSENKKSEDDTSSKAIWN